MKKPLVSVVIPTYNDQEYVEDAIKSVLSQTYGNIEILVVDDGSTDNTKDKLNPYINSHDIEYIYQANKGLSGARNTGVMSASGEYIAFLDADDLFKSDKIEKQLKYLMGHPDCDYCYCDVYLFRDGQPNKLFRYDYKYYSGNIFKYLLRQNFINPSTLFFQKKNIIDNFGLFDESFRRVEDLEYTLRVSLIGARFCFLDEPLFLSRVRRGGNLQSSQVLMQEYTLKILKDVEKKLTPSDKENYGLEGIINSRKVKLALAYLANGDSRLGREEILNVNHIYISKVFVLLLSIMPTSLINFIVNRLTTLRRRILFKKRVRDI